MKMVVKYEHGGKIVTRYEKVIAKKEDYKAGLEEAADAFHRENPKLSLFDGVTVTYDKAD